MAPISLSSGRRTERWHTRVHSTPLLARSVHFSAPTPSPRPILESRVCSSGPVEKRSISPEPSCSAASGSIGRSGESTPSQLVATVDVFESMAARDSRTCSDRATRDGRYGRRPVDETRDHLTSQENRSRASRRRPDKSQDRSSAVYQLEHGGISPTKDLSKIRYHFVGRSYSNRLRRRHGLQSVVD